MKMRKLIFSAFRKIIALLWGTGITKFPLVGSAIYSAFKFLYEHLRPREAVIVETEGNKMCVVPGYRSAMTLSLLIHGCYIHEKLRTELFKTQIRQGMTVIDLGADIGYYTLLAAKLVGKNGGVFAFEPAPDNYALLTKNIALNGYKNVVPVQKAVSSENGQLKLFLCDYESMLSNLYTSYDERGKFVMVDTIPLDEFFRDKDLPIDFIKMDVEGAEMATLEGMTNIIEKNRNLKILVEVHADLLRKAGSSREEFLNKLIGYGFKLYAINERENRIETFDATSFPKAYSDWDLVDFFCIRED